MKQVMFTQTVVPMKSGVRGAAGTSGPDGSNGSFAGSDGSNGGGGSPGGDGGHTTFGNETTATATQISTPTIKFGATEFEHGVGGAGQDGGVVLYLIW